MPCSCLDGRVNKIAAYWSTCCIAALTLADLLMLAFLLFRAINMHIGAPVMIERISKVIPLCLAAVSALVIRIAPFRAGGGGRRSHKVVVFAVFIVLLVVAEVDSPSSGHGRESRFPIGHPLWYRWMSCCCRLFSRSTGNHACPAEKPRLCSSHQYPG